MLMNILQNIKFFACKGLPLRNHEEADSSFLQFFLLRGLDFHYDRAWMKWIFHRYD